MIRKIDRWVEEKNRNKFLDFTSMELHSADENKEVLKNTKNFGMGLKMRSRP